jgi:hypothetical protein
MIGFIKKIKYFSIEPRYLYGKHYTSKIDDMVSDQSKNLSKYLITLSTGSIALTFTMLQLLDGSLQMVNILKFSWITFVFCILFGLGFEILQILKKILWHSFQEGEQKLAPEDKLKALDEEMVQLKFSFENSREIDILNGAAQEDLNQKELSNLYSRKVLIDKALDIRKESVMLATYGIYSFKLIWLGYFLLLLEIVAFLTAVSGVVIFMLVNL